MRFLRDITFTVCVLSAACTLLMMLVPDRYRREIRSVISLIAAVTVCASLLGADFSDIGTQFHNISFQSEVESRNRLVQSELEGKVSEYISSLLSEEGIECKNIAVRTTIDEQNSIFITEAELLLEKNDKEREQFIRGLIAERIGEIEVKISYEDS